MATVPAYGRSWISTASPRADLGPFCDAVSRPPNAHRVFTFSFRPTRLTLLRFRRRTDFRGERCGP